MMKKRRPRRLWLLLLLLYAAFMLLLLSLILHDGWWSTKKSRPGQEYDNGWASRRLCPSLDTSVWEEEVQEGAELSPQPRTHVYLHATWRSGSSFLGELFNQHPGVFYLYEPAWHMWQSLYPGDAESLQGALRDLLRSLFRCDFSALRLYAGDNLTTAGLFGWKNNKVICSAPLCSAGHDSASTAGGARDRVGLIKPGDCQQRCPARPLRDLEEECRRYPVVVIKDVRLMEVSALLPLLRDPGLNLRIVQLFRDPRAMQNSRLRSKRSLLRESLQVLRSRLRGGDPASRAQQQQQLHRGGTDYLLSGSLEVICQGWLRDLLLVRAHSTSWLRQRYLKVRYEDLVLSPRKELGRLLRFTGLPAVPELDDFVMNMTQGPSYSSDQPFLVSARNAREAVNAWRERLSREQVRRVEEACGEAMQILAYKAEADDTAT
ncbi:PREDICTED: carbohydrate sulfotransferase 7 [Nanorana parkeri]|uniref:carbohydrate sulfotransferase 7 n=1 Tax=Nanorana parkeri TaxID=125878 RepID=UPI00085432BD|nr:PREDICTED: carbohydrate sulfotransferase 7 [Nanorana parkeri]